MIRYSLRHTASTEALRSGVTSEARDRFLGHKPKDTKGQHYEEPDLRYLSTEINKIPGFLVLPEDGEPIDDDQEPEVWSRIWSREPDERSSGNAFDEAVDSSK